MRRNILFQEVMRYAKLIAAMLLTAYKVFNGLRGYKLLKLRFEPKTAEKKVLE